MAAVTERIDQMITANDVNDITLEAAGTGTTEEAGEPESIQKLRKLLNKTLKITLTDGRTLVGTFLCIDKFKNIILGGCQETTKNGTE